MFKIKCFKMSVRVFELFRVDHGWASQEPGDDYVCAEEHDGILQGKLRTILTFLHSFCYDKVGKREKVGTLMGKDPFGNSYYELPAQPQVKIQSNMKSLRPKKIKLCAVGKEDAHSVV